MYGTLRIAPFLLSLALVACTGVSPEPSDQPAGSDAPSVTKPMLPAHALPGERKGAGKADQYDDYRNGNPNVFGITAAPKTPLRAVAQWDDHESMLLAWTGNFPETYAGIVKAAKDVIDIYVVHDGFQSKQQFTSQMSAFGASTSGVKYLDMSLNSIWIRDYGPLSARAPDGTVAMIDPRYYHQRVYDDAIPTLLANDWGMNSFRQPLSWEGGTFIADGRGNCIYTQGVYQYGGTTVEKIHKYQKDYLGCDTSIVTKPLAGEGTTHSDMFSKMVAPGHVLLGEYTSGQDFQNKIVLDDDAEILESAILNDGSKLKVTRIPMPSNSDKTVWRTYANSLFVNGVNLVPVYTDETSKEAAAMAVWQNAMPDWQHVKVDSTNLIQWSGAVHCITMTVPKGKQEKVEANPAFLCNGGFNCFPSNTQVGSCSQSFEGCCDGSTLNTCDDGGSTTQSCGGQGCGWSNTTMAYQCGGSGAGPIANAPLQCGAMCVPNCAGKTCGSNGCGGSCGTCGQNESCLGGVCQENNDPCGGIGYVGCCDGSTLKYCDSGQLVTTACQNCGWEADNGWYNCGASGSDPSGQNPKSCPGECTPDCAGKACGSDGCGGSCGSCGGGQSCTAGQCVCVPKCSGKQCGTDGCGGTCGTCAAGSVCNAQQKCAAQCVPDCAGKSCGADGCSGSCGTCAGGESCDAGQCVAAAGCGDVSFEGKCVGSVLTWCEDGATLQSFDCATDSLECKAHPGTNPPNFDCLPSAGCVPSCSGKSCGADGCGGVCGVCSGSTNCIQGQCVSDNTDPCNGVTFEGCCDGGVLNWCEDGAPQTAQCGNQGCGWDSGNNWYNCGFDGDGPAEFPKECGGSACVADCAGKVCGSDGCGGQCGTCTGADACVAGQCTNTCGDVSFEGECSGSTLSYCEGGLETVDCATLADGACCGWSAEDNWATCLASDACQSCTDACAAGETGCSSEGQHEWTCTEVAGCLVRDFTACESGCDVAKGACKDDGPLPCTADCAGKECGGDGCGDSCGQCGAGSSCNASGQCIAACVADCTNKQCGSDGCGGLCGTCGGGEQCVEGECVPGSCQPKCDGKVCGDDSCGGICGTCSAGMVCDKDGQCIPEAVCVPNCDGKSCGPDGCGDSCGVCQKDFSCKDGQCIEKPQNNCGGVPTTGVCEGDVLKFCGEDGQVGEVNCNALGLKCGATPGTGFDCIDPNACIPACAGKQCGSDGCGGTCGNCSKGDSCTSDGQCVSDTCTPVCDGKVCGSDGCGGLCGTCPQGMGCNAGACEAAQPCADGSLPVDGKCPDGGTTSETTGGTTAGTDDESGNETSGGCSSVGDGRKTQQNAGGTALALLFFGGILALRRRHNGNN